MICSRRAAAVEATVQELRVGQDAGDLRAHGVACDVSRPADVDALVDATRDVMGGCDLWVNNAGSNGYRYAALVDTSPEAIIEVVSCNLTGTLLCCRAAMRLMIAQPQGGHMFNMLGAGSDHGATDQYAVYGATKAALPQLAKSLQLEVGDAPVGVHNISPGLVWTELIQAGRDTFGAQGRWFINALCEPADDVARAMLPLLLQVGQQPRRPGQGSQTLRVLPPQLAAQRLLARVLTGKNKGRWYPEE